MIRQTALALVVSSFLSTPSSALAFVPLGRVSLSQHTRLLSSTEAADVTSTTTHNYAQADERTSKPTGISFLPAETIARAEQGSPVEKVKLEKDGTSAFVDVYEYARKIREGEMTWEEVEKADLESVRYVAVVKRG